MIQIQLFGRVVFIGNNRISQQGTGRSRKGKQQETGGNGVVIRIGKRKAENNPCIENIIQSSVKKNAEVCHFRMAGNCTVKSVKSPVDENTEQCVAIHFHCQKINGKNADDKSRNRNQICGNAAPAEVFSRQVEKSVNKTVNFLEKTGNLGRHLLDSQFFKLISDTKIVFY